MEVSLLQPLLRQRLQWRCTWIRSISRSTTTIARSVERHSACATTPVHKYADSEEALWWGCRKTSISSPAWPCINTTQDIVASSTTQSSSTAPARDMDWRARLLLWVTVIIFVLMVVMDRINRKSTTTTTKAGTPGRYLELSCHWIFTSCTAASPAIITSQPPPLQN